MHFNVRVILLIGNKLKENLGKQIIEDKDKDRYDTYYLLQHEAYCRQPKYYKENTMSN